MAEATLNDLNAQLKEINAHLTNPVQSPGDKEAAGEESLVPFLWADGSDETPTIQLNQICDAAGSPCELVGWLFFEVPKDIEYYQFIWETGDNVYMPFSGTR